MIVGIGTDLVEIERVGKACEREAFLARYFTEKEAALFYPNAVFLPAKAAGNFAAKEALSKALGTGVRGFELHDIEVLRDELGKPFINLYRHARELVEALGADRIHVSISNTREYASAYVILEQTGG